MKWLFVAVLFGLGGSAFAQAPQSACVTDYGKTACGFQCVANYGQVRCAQTQWGACSSNYGKVVCWDPPYALGRHAPAAECLSNYGKTECGYHCVANYGKVRCAQTPAGACEANYGQVVCWDPPRDVGRRAPAAECISNYGKIACGYSCVANYGAVKCAEWPDAQCYAEGGKLYCSDGS